MWRFMINVLCLTICALVSFIHQITKGLKPNICFYTMDNDTNVYKNCFVSDFTHVSQITFFSENNSKSNNALQFDSNVCTCRVWSSTIYLIKTLMLWHNGNFYWKTKSTFSSTLFPSTVITLRNLICIFISEKDVIEKKWIRYLKC